MTDTLSHDEAIAQATERGSAAGSWVLDGNSTVETARRIIDGYNDGDPEIMDLQPAALSGEWAGESMVELGLEGADDELLDAYEEAYGAAFWYEVIRNAKQYVGEDD